MIGGACPSTYAYSGPRVAGYHFASSANTLARRRNHVSSFHPSTRKAESDLAIVGQNEYRARCFPLSIHHKMMKADTEKAFSQSGSFTNPHSGQVALQGPSPPDRRYPHCSHRPSCLRLVKNRYIPTGMQQAEITNAGNRTNAFSGTRESMAVKSLPPRRSARPAQTNVVTSVITTKPNNAQPPMRRHLPTRLVVLRGTIGVF